MYTKSELNLIVLASFKELTYKNVSKLLSGMTCGTPDFVKHRDFLIKTLGDGVYNKVKEKFYSPAYREKILIRLAERGIKCVTYFSERYPEGLKQIPCPPVTLFCKGRTELLKTRCFSVVGSRRTPPDVAKLTTKTCEELTQHFTIVTGLADGADAAALVGAVKSGKVISVLANGFDFVYPSVNDSLLKRIEKEGLIITEYTPRMPPLAYNFPVRNRIIAGLSEGTLVVSAGKKSGAVITAEYALEYGRRVFAFPHSAGITCGEGCNNLIREGATLTRNARDVFDDFGLKYEEPVQKLLTPDEANLLSLIRDAGEGFAPEIAAKMGKLPFQIIPVLSSLEIKGLIARLGGNRYSAI